MKQTQRSDGAYTNVSFKRNRSCGTVVQAWLLARLMNPFVRWTELPHPNGTGHRPIPTIHCHSQQETGNTHVNPLCEGQLSGLSDNDTPATRYRLVRFIIWNRIRIREKGKVRKVWSMSGIEPGPPRVKGNHSTIAPHHRLIYEKLL